MAKVTDLDAIREMAVAFLMMKPEIIPEVPFFVQHPFFENTHYPVIDTVGKMGKKLEMFNIFEDRENFQKYLDLYRSRIMHSSVDGIYTMILPKYWLGFLKYTKQYMTKRDFDTRFADVWVQSENPNQDKNVPTRTLVSWFRHANRKYLMNADEMAVYDSLPKQVKAYRGVGKGRAAGNGLSWTCNYDTARWFADRFGHGGYILQGVINKEDIFAYFNRRGEDEICCDPSKVINLTVER